MATNPYETPGAKVLDPVASEGAKLSWSQIFFKFDGRIPRKAFWIAIIPIVILQFIMQALVGDGKEPPGLIASLLLLVFAVLIVWTSIAVAIKRWHDRDKSGWWVLISFIPIIGWIWALVENGFLRGTVGGNRFGGDPTDLY